MQKNIISFSRCRGEQLLSNITVHTVDAPTTSGALSFLQEDITRPGTFLGVRGKDVIEFTDKPPVINLTPNYNYAGITALYQLNDSILVVDSNAKCIVRIDRSHNSVTTHSGKCKPAASAAFDGSFLDARYRYPYDLTSRVGNYTHLYILDDNSLRLINQITETVMSVFRGYWFLDRLGFIENNIMI